MHLKINYNSTFSCSYSSIYSCRSLVGNSRHINPIIFPISHNLWSGFSVLTLSQTRREYLMYGINGFSGGFGGLGVFGSNCLIWKQKFKISIENVIFFRNFSCVFHRMDHSSNRLLTMFELLLTFCGVNAGLPWLLWLNGFESLLRSDWLDPPDARNRSVDIFITQKKERKTN